MDSLSLTILQTTPSTKDSDFFFFNWKQINYRPQIVVIVVNATSLEASKFFPFVIA